MHTLMDPNVNRHDLDDRSPASLELESITGYEEGGSFVIRNEDDPEAWIRSDRTRELGR